MSTDREKTYVIRRAAAFGVTASVRLGAEIYPLRHVPVHSPTGLETGYGGSGPADLALSILCDYLGAEARDSADFGWDAAPEALLAWRLHQGFKFAFIAPRKLEVGARYEISARDIHEWIAEQSSSERGPISA